MIDDPIERGLAAWRDGDLTGLAQVLHPDVTLRWVQPGPWDCEGREQVLAELQRVAEQQGTGSVSVQRLDETTYVVTLRESEGIATHVRVADGLVVSMQQFADEPNDEPAASHVAAVRDGDVERLRDLLAADPDAANRRLRGYGDRTLLHIATDWPGHRPRVAETIQALLDAGAHPDAAMTGDHAETPLHWAASSDDLAALDALLDGGADIDAPGAVVAGGTPLNDATAFGQWNAARRLVERGARASAFDAATLGLDDRLQELLAEHPDESLDALLWGACHGGRRETATYLVSLGGDPTWVGWDDLTPIGAAERAGADDLAAWLRDRGGSGAAPE